MYVRNVAGYNFAFYYRDAVIHIPFDGRIYSIPDDSGVYKELRVIQPMHIRTQSVTYINKDGSVASANLSGHKRRGRPPKDENKTSDGVVANTKKTVDTIVDDVNVSIVDIDIDLEHNIVNEKVETSTPEEPPKKKRGRPRKVVDDNTKDNAKPAPKKKRGRPRKTQK